MRYLIIFFLFSTIAFMSSIFLYMIFGSISKNKNIKENETNFKTRTLFKQKNSIPVKPENSNINYSIDLFDSISITQYGNDLLKEFGNLSDFMLALSKNSFIEQANINFQEIAKIKDKEIDESLFDKFNFISNYTKYKLVEQVKLVQPKIYSFESKISEFDKVIDYANDVILKTKIQDSKSSIDSHRNMTLKSNIELLNNKIISLKKNKLYYEQSIVQLKTIMNINNSIIVNFDDVIHQVLPLMKNKKTLDSIKLVNFDSFNQMLKDLEKLTFLKITN